MVYATVCVCVHLIHGICHCVCVCVCVCTWYMPLLHWTTNDDSDYYTQIIKITSWIECYVCVCVCVCVGRKKSLRSLEIPLDNLLSGIIYTAGTSMSTHIQTYFPICQ